MLRITKRNPGSCWQENGTAHLQELASGEAAIIACAHFPEVEYPKQGVGSR